RLRAFEGSLRCAKNREKTGTDQAVVAILQGVSNSIRGIYTTKASGDFECTFVSENIEQILGYRFRHYDGHYRWFQDSFKTVHDDSGQPVEIVLKPQRRVDFNPNSMGCPPSGSTQHPS